MSVNQHNFGLLDSLYWKFGTWKITWLLLIQMGQKTSAVELNLPEGGSLEETEAVKL